jgi:hypothetical protein
MIENGFYKIKPDFIQLINELGADIPIEKKGHYSAALKIPESKICIGLYRQVT